MLRQCAPLTGDYVAGDIVCYREQDMSWFPACRVLGFDGDRTVWLVNAGVPVCAALKRLRLVTSAEALAMQYLARPTSVRRRKRPPTSSGRGGGVGEEVGQKERWGRR